MAEHVLSILVKAVGAGKASKDLKGVDLAIHNIGRRAGKGFGAAASNLKTLATAAAGISLAGIAGSIKVAADFESQLNTINTVARKTPAELDKIGDAIRGLAKKTGTPLDDLTQGFYDLVSAGVDAGQAMTVLTSANTLAIGGLSTSAESVDLLTTALNTYGVSAKNQGAESQRFADIFAKSIERGKVTAAELAASFAQVGPIAASNKVEIEELAAGYAQLTAKGVPASEAATQMAAAMIALQRRTVPLEKLEKQTGKSYLALAGKKGLVAAFEQLRIDAKKSGVPLIDLVGRVEGLQFALNTTGPEFANYNANLAAMNKANGTAGAQMAERQKGLNAQLAKLKALAIDAGITIGEKLLPKLTPLAEKAVAFLNTHQGDIDKFGDSIAGAFDRAAGFAQKIPWGAIGSGLQTAATWAGKLMDVFLALPPEAQATIVALAGLNKLSGGAVTGIVGELGKGLIKGVLGMNAGVVNINAGVVNGAGVVPGAPPVAPVPATSFLDTLKTMIVRAGPAAFLGSTGVTNSLGVLDNKDLADAEKRRIEELMAAGLTLTQAFKQAQQELATGALTVKAAVPVNNAASRTKDDLTEVGLKQLAVLNATRDKVESTRIANASAAAQAAAASATLRDKIEGARIATLSIAAAVRAKDFSVSTTFSPIINTTVSVRETINTRTTYRRFQRTAS